MDLVKIYPVLHGVQANSAKGGRAQEQLEVAISLFGRVLLINPQNWAEAWLECKAAQSLGQPERAYGYVARSFGVQKKKPT